MGLKYSKNTIFELSVWKMASERLSLIHPVLAFIWFNDEKSSMPRLWMYSHSQDCKKTCTLRPLSSGSDTILLAMATALEGSWNKHFRFWICFPPYSPLRWYSHGLDFRFWFSHGLGIRAKGAYPPCRHVVVVVVLIAERGETRLVDLDLLVVLDLDLLVVLYLDVFLGLYWLPGKKEVLSLMAIKY